MVYSFPLLLFFTFSICLINVPLLAEPEAIEHDLVTYFDAAQPDEQKAYALGQYLAHRLMSLESAPEPNALLLGLKEGLNQYNRLDPLLSQEHVAQWQTHWNKIHLKNWTESNQERLIQAKQFWEENRQRATVHTNPSGLQWEVIQAGNGTPPKLHEEVVLHYRGSFKEGKEFDSSKRRGKPLTIRVEDTLPGWKEALLQMSPGATWRLYLMPHLAFAEHGIPPYVPGNSLVIFDIELTRIEKSSPFP